MAARHAVILTLVMIALAAPLLAPPAKAADVNFTLVASGFNFHRNTPTTPEDPTLVANAGAGIAALPRPGPWMVRVKQAFGVIILATAAYYGYVAYGIIANRWVDPASVASSVEEKLKEGWYASLADGLAQANLERKPVLIDMWATWCKNCLTMDKTTLADPEVKAALEGYVKIKLQAEDPSVEPARSVMARLGGIGLPTYAILRPN